ncbi:uncharacterized protein LOC125307843 isoform X2 [Alosa alosa]|uniref:uncharacterized protein LOC125307843 isoform X2 n=1 Tax=Alosa alosa TaxID=278164 RepID=UPI00201523FF|nr:uncharacterized protein LOC125307843 isoform X2 [Alosa alosa]
MIVTMLTAMYMMVKAAEQLGVRWGKEPEPLPYMLSQPIPWQIHSVSNSRRGSRAEERRNSLYRKSPLRTLALNAVLTPAAVTVGALPPVLLPTPTAATAGALPPVLKR